MTETGPPVTCSNCGSAQVSTYCAACGERQPTKRDFTTTALVAEAASEFASVDGRLWRSIVALLSKPGFLAQEQKRSVLLVAIPLFAVVLSMLYVRSGRTFVEHVVFSVHSYAFMVFYLLAIGTFGFTAVFWLLRLLHAPPAIWRALDGETALLIVMGAGMVFYIQSGLRRYFGSGRLASVARALVLFSVQGLLIAMFHTLLFHSVLLSL